MHTNSHRGDRIIQLKLVRFTVNYIVYYKVTDTCCVSVWPVHPGGCQVGPDSCRGGINVWYHFLLCVGPKGCQGCKYKLNSSKILVEVSVTSLWLSYGYALQLVMGPSGVLQGIRPGKCYIEMSTVDPETITELSQVYSNTHTPSGTFQTIKISVAFLYQIVI